jgi:murein endopeptidase
MMSLAPILAAFFATLLAERPAPPPAKPVDPVDLKLKGVPRLRIKSPTDVQRGWMGLKGLGSVAAQLDAIRKREIEAWSCKGLVDVRTLARNGGPLEGVGFRDNVRNRGWARPTMALLLAEALSELRREFPGRTITIGDIAQPGCGQINHGVLVDELDGSRAADFLRDAVPMRGVLTTVEVRRGSDFPGEGDRFESPDQPVRVTMALRGAEHAKGGALRLRVARTRHIGTGRPDEAMLAAMTQDFRGLARKDRRVSVTTVDDLRGRMALWHFVDPRGGQQLQVLATGNTARVPTLDQVVELRFGRWQDGKPGSFPGEILWIREAQGWSRWSQLNEAGHISHLSGIDADLSYVTVDNAAHFAVNPSAMDVAATWRWFEILDATARRMKLQLETILVDRVIRDHLRANLPMKGPRSVARHRLWGLIKLSPGHDGHHHLRIAEPPSKLEAAAVKRLGAR